MSQQKTAVDHQGIAWQAELANGEEILVNVYATMQAAEAVVRGIAAGRIRGYRPAGHFEAGAYPHSDGAAVWVRYVHGLGLAPLPQSMTVRVPDKSGRTGPVAEVKIAARCPMCGGPRGETRPKTLLRSGVRHVRDTWTNSCDHEDDDRAVLREARRSPEHPGYRTIQPVEGGRYATAVALLADALSSNPWLSAQRGVELLNKHKQFDAVRTVQTFALSSVSGPNTSAKSAALYLNHLDSEACATADTGKATGGKA
ncbi:hypothetical protein PV387_23165 [Streptomyces sp. ME02-6987-2C]|uniref:hypothetical protein n=1 Tax=unclassified Streptomyces TaxID=2593676 RepID=UPI0029B9851B|nr:MULTISPECIES: hypothetical protein [unclassified Streptomyces]MDX3345991.1 hypothetical protein [Streptomyces sp. ME02-6979A]MDX3368903.1 hypothetical protein [Streptomyces sp. ME02-6987-2C]MDX3407800.1 hypothetical protein [Streptomyces sp. ME02-6977A]MDX3421757.1 hypothetical protein [Streptomyces sp. ME02-6985-2c]